MSFPFLPGGAPPASTTPNPNRSQQPHLCSIRPRSPGSGSSSHLGSLSGFRRAGLEGSQGLPELKLSALLSLNPLQNPSKNPSRSSLTAPPQKFSLGTIPLQTQRLGCSRSLFFFPREIAPSAIPADSCHLSGPCCPKSLSLTLLPTGISAPLPPGPASVNPDGCDPSGFVAFANSCPFLSHPSSALSH